MQKHIKPFLFDIAVINDNSNNENSQKIFNTKKSQPPFDPYPNSPYLVFNWFNNKHHVKNLKINEDKNV